LLTITDISGNTEALTGYRGLRRKRNVNGEKTLAFLVLPTEQNTHSYPMVSTESVVEFNGEPYRIKQIAEKSKGTKFFKEVVAVHTFFDLIDDHVYALHTGSMTFETAMQFVFGGTEYTWSIVDTFYAQDFENFGDQNRLALFQTLLERYGAEFTLNGTHITFRQRIGNATDFQFRYNYNVKTISRDIKTSNLSTYIKGFGKKNDDGTYVVESEYTSPNASVFGIRHAKPIRDEQYTTLDGLNARLQAELNDEPEVSITIDFADLRRAGFPYDVPNEGDDVFLIYEPIGIDVETRLFDIDEEFTEGNDLPIKTTVTLGNIRDSVVDRWANVEKQVNDIIGSDGKVKYNVLDAAVKRATEALQSAQTELEFGNGIIARSKVNPNHLVLYNSAGFGISTDGGQTFKEAITAEGFVLSAGAIGQLSANNIQIGPATTFDEGYDPTDKVDYDSYAQEIATIHNQLDGKVESWFYSYDPTTSNEPASLWTTDADKESHVGDTFTNIDNGYSWRYLFKDNAYQWVRIADTDAQLALEAASRAQDTADGKRRVFVTQPAPPYDIGDLWVQGTSGDIMRCKTSKLSGTYSASDWEKASKYTDDAMAITAESNAKAYADTIKTALAADISDVSDSVSDLSSYVDGTFKDGVITKAEALGIEQRLNQLQAEKADLDSRYVQVYNNADLTDSTAKTGLETKKTAYNTAHSNFVTAISNAIADSSITPAEKTAVESAESAYVTALSNLSAAFETAVNAIATKKSATSLTSAKAYSDGLKLAIDSDIQDVAGDLSALNTYVDGAFEDGVVSQAEAKAIEKYLNQINAEKADIDSRYNTIYNASELTNTTEKTTLNTAKTAYNTAHTNLTTSINNAIADGKTTTTEKTDVDSKFTAYRTSLGTLSTAFENAVNKIAQVKVNNVELGGRNLIRDSNFATGGMTYWRQSGNVANTFQVRNENSFPLSNKHGYVLTDGVNNEALFAQDNIPVISGETYTISGWFYVNVGAASIQVGNGTMGYLRADLTTLKKWTRLVYTFIPTTTTISVYFGSKGSVNGAGVLASMVFTALQLEKGNKASDWGPSVEDVKAEISGVAQSVTDLNTFVTGSFKDGVITNAEAVAIAKYINIVNADKSDLDNRFTTVYAITELSGTTERTALNTAKTNYNTAHAALITSINTAIADGATTTTEAADVDTKYTTYRTRIAELSTAFENAINKIASVKAAAAQSGAVTAVKTDLRMTAPLPTSLNLSADGITASTPTTDKYARLDYRGLYINKGAIQIQRDDGYNLIMDGKANFDFGVDSADPPFMDSGVTVEGYWFRTSATSPVSCNYYTFKHTGRYLKMQIAFYKTGSGNTGGLQIAANGGGSLVSKSFISGNTAQAAIVGEVFTVDLGTPTGNLTSVYLRAYQDIANGNVYVRKIRAWLEG
jgi:phage minor structural protein